MVRMEMFLLGRIIVSNLGHHSTKIKVIRIRFVSLVGNLSSILIF